MKSKQPIIYSCVIDSTNPMEEGVRFALDPNDLDDVPPYSLDGEEPPKFQQRVVADLHTVKVASCRGKDGYGSVRTDGKTVFPYFDSLDTGIAWLLGQDEDLVVVDYYGANHTSETYKLGRKS